MATSDDIKEAISCLSTVFPQFVSKELATLTDSVATAIQGFVDPLAALGDIDLDSLVTDVEVLSQDDVFDDLKSAAIGFGTQHVKRDARTVLDAISKEFASPIKRVQQIRNLSNELVSTAQGSMRRLPDFPYAAAQKMCETIIGLDDLKVANLQCLKKHVAQLVNSILVLLSNEDYKKDILGDLELAKTQLRNANTELGKSQVIRDGQTVFDSKAFQRARDSMLAANRLLTPDKGSANILAETSVLTAGSINSDQASRENQALVHIAIPQIANLIDSEIQAVVSQIEVINFHVTQLDGLIANYRRTATSSRIQTERSRAIESIKAKLVELCVRIELALDRESLTQASSEMLAWSSTVKTIIATIDKVSALSLQEGSIAGPDKAFELEEALAKLIADLRAISSSLTDDGLEEPLIFRDKVLSLTKAARRILVFVEEGKVPANKLATFHELAAQTADDQIGLATESISVALQQKAICQVFANLDIPARPQYDSLLDSMRQVGMDRGVDMLGVGQFEEFLESDTDSQSYLGAAVNCLTHALDGIDDIQTRRLVITLRDDMLSSKINIDIASADAADQGRSRFISALQEDIANIQKSAKTVESIVEDLTGLLAKAGEAVDESLGSVTTFLGNVDQLAIGAGGRLAASLEEVSDHPNAGVPQCGPL